MAKHFDVKENRLDYGNLLQSPADYRLSFATGLTYSLDLEALLSVPIFLGMCDDFSDINMSNPFYMLEAINKCIDNLAIFCNCGSILMPKEVKSVYTLLENSVFEVIPKLKSKTANFHPKLWVIRYDSYDDDNSIIRVIVLSRNLTFDKSFDISVMLEGKISKRKYTKNQPLCDMLDYVAGFVKYNIAKKKQIIELSEQLQFVDFKKSLQNDFEDYEFLPFGIDTNKNSLEDLLQNNRNMFVVSPFLTNSVISDLSNNLNGNLKLITRKSSVSKTVLEKVKDIFVVKDSVSNNLADEDYANRDIHAKIYFANKKDANYLYLGSLNASRNAFYNNIEFMLKLKHKSGFSSLNMFSKDILNANDIDKDNKGPFERLSSLFNPEAYEKKEEDTISFRPIIFALNKAFVTNQEDGNYTITINCSEINSEYEYQISPLQIDCYKKITGEDIIFKNIPAHLLSCFYKIRFEDKTIVVKIETKNMPNDRDKKLMKNLIPNKQSFLSYISMILATDKTIECFNQSNNEAVTTEHCLYNSSKQINYNSAIYEKMLDAIVYNPESVIEIKESLSFIDDELIDDDFKELYEVFLDAQKKVK